MSDRARAAARKAAAAHPAARAALAHSKTLVSRRAHANLYVGETIAQRYQILEELGEGGMAIVFRVLDVNTERELALKVLKALPEAHTLIPRFRQEVELTRMLSHPNVIRVHDLGEAASLVFMTMELLDGRSLDALVEEQAPLSPTRVVDYAIQICAAVEATHDAGILHRDIKPANLFLTQRGVVKLMDFGVAKHVASEKRMTSLGVMIGTPEYMAPEQILDATAAKVPSDLYSIGVSLYEMLSGELPFSHEHLMELLRLQSTQAPPPLRTYVPDLPDALEALVLALLAKHPAERPRSATEVRDALTRIARAL